MIKVKICGVTHKDDALWAASLGADFVGLNFYPPSPRKVSVKNAKEIVAALPPFIIPVGVFVDEPMDSLAKAVKSAGLKAVQLHGAETPETAVTVRALGVKVIKAIRLAGPLQETQWMPYADHVDYFLFDVLSETAPGGTGQTFDWTWLAGSSQLPKPWFLAGGLTPENLREALTTAHPALVDVCSGVERSPTRKEFERMKQFIQTAKAFR